MTNLRFLTYLHSDGLVLFECPITHHREHAITSEARMLTNPIPYGES